MSGRAQAMADQFEKVSADFISMLEGLSDEQWQTTLDREGWPVRVGACHIAEHYSNIAQLVSVVANGGPMPDWAPKKPEDLDRLNAEIAARNAGRSKEEALEMLRTNAAAAIQQVQGLSDEQLERKAALPAVGREFSAQEIAQVMLIGHILMHMPSIQQAAAST